MSVTVRSRFWFHWRLIALLTIVSIACGCAAGPGVVGRWQAMEGKASVTFTSDGRFDAVDHMGTAVTGKYRLTGIDGIHFEVRHDDHETEVIDARVVRLKDRLMLSFPGEASTETYRRIP